MMTEIPITVVEFQTSNPWSKAEREEFIDFIARHPDAGIPLGGYLYKVRWARRGKGKSGGYRIIYTFFDFDNPVFVIYVFGKNQRDNIAPAEKRELKRIAAEIKRSLEND